MNIVPATPPSPESSNSPEMPARPKKVKFQSSPMRMTNHSTGPIQCDLTTHSEMNVDIIRTKVLYIGDKRYEQGPERMEVEIKFLIEQCRLMNLTYLYHDTIRQTYFSQDCDIKTYMKQLMRINDIHANSAKYNKQFECNK